MSGGDNYINKQHCQHCELDMELRHSMTPCSDHIPLSVSPRTITNVCVLAILDVHAPARPRPHSKHITIGQLNQLRLIRHDTYIHAANGKHTAANLANQSAVWTPVSECLYKTAWCSTVYKLRLCTAIWQKNEVKWIDLTLSSPIPSRLYTLSCWSNQPFLIFDIRALWCSVLSARAPECQKSKMVGYTSMAQNTSNSSNLKQLALNGLVCYHTLHTSVHYGFTQQTHAHQTTAL